MSLFDPALGSRVTLPADRVVLSTGVEPNDNRELARIFGVELNPDGFFMEANPKSAPLDSVDRGKFFCGLCHSPNFIEDAISRETRRLRAPRHFCRKKPWRRRPSSPM